jgi:hypothetical protein
MGNASLAEQLRHAKQTFSLNLAQPQDGLTVTVTGGIVAVPLDDFQEEDCQSFYNYSMLPENKQRVFYDVVPAANVVLLFGLPELTCQTIEQELGEVHYESLFTSVMRHVFVKELGQRIFVYLLPNEAIVMACENAKLRLLNTYKVQTVEDVAYFVVNIANTLNFNLQQTKIDIAGDATMRNPLLVMMRQFAPNTLPVLPANEFKHHEIASEEEMPYDMMTFIFSHYR